jgi:hypothetical protein
MLHHKTPAALAGDDWAEDEGTAESIAEPDRRNFIASFQKAALAARTPDVLGEQTLHAVICGCRVSQRNPYNDYNRDRELVGWWRWNEKGLGQPSCRPQSRVLPHSGIAAGALMGGSPFRLPDSKPSKHFRALVGPKLPTRTLAPLETAVWAQEA